jgi:hypothetical protein
MCSCSLGSDAYASFLAPTTHGAEARFLYISSASFVLCMCPSVCNSDYTTMSSYHSQSTIGFEVCG